MVRKLEGPHKTFVEVVSVVFAMVFIYNAVETVPYNISLPLYIALTNVLIFCLYPVRRGERRDRIPPLDIVLSLLTVATVAFFMSQFDFYINKAGIYRTQDFVFSVVAMALCLESCRRVLGPSLPIVFAASLAYAMFGSKIPGQLGHKGYSLTRIAATCFGFEGIFGTVTSTYATYVLLFVIFGALIEASGLGAVLTNLAMGLVGRAVGGVAKTAILSSAAVGMIMGSGAANVAVTGTFTIPLMKSAGYDPDVAGAVETTASAGGTLMPPIMGSVAFLMSAFTGIPYSRIALISFLPAVLYYWGIYIQVHLFSAKHRLATPPDVEIPRVSSVLKRHGYMLLPVVAVFVLIFTGISPYKAAVYSLGLTTILWAYRERPSIGRVVHAIGDGAVASLSVGGSAGVIGMILVCLSLPGLPLKFASWAVSAAGGNLFILLLLCLAVSYVFGMGMTNVASYVILTIIAVPALIQAGIPLMVSHLVIMWFCLSAFWTPPVAPGAFVAAGISGGNPTRTGLWSVRFGISLYVVPLLMVFGNIVQGTPLQIVFSFLCIAVSLWCFAAAIEGYSSRGLTKHERALRLVAALMTMWPLSGTRIVGLAVSALTLALERLGRVRIGEC